MAVSADGPGWTVPRMVALSRMGQACRQLSRSWLRKPKSSLKSQTRLSKYHELLTLLIITLHCPLACEELHTGFNSLPSHHLTFGVFMHSVTARKGHAAGARQTDRMERIPVGAQNPLSQGCCVCACRRVWLKLDTHREPLSRMGDQTKQSNNVVEINVQRVFANRVACAAPSAGQRVPSLSTQASALGS